MKNRPPKPTQYDRDQILQLIEQQIAQGTNSSEIIGRIVTDRAGEKHILGGESHEVIIGEDSIPRIISQQHVHVLDCGHIVTTISEVMGACDYGHIICHRHELYMCQECRKLLCDKDVEEKDGKAICHECNSNYTILIVIGVIVLVIIILASLNGR
jgi:hypothetical protein